MRSQSLGQTLGSRIGPRRSPQGGSSDYLSVRRVNRLRKKAKAGLLQRTLEQQKEQLNALLERRHEKHEHAAIVDTKPSRLGRLWNRVRQILKGVSA
jgi:hypothetical protein